MHQQLFDALEQEATVVTANQRLARNLVVAFAAAQQCKGRQVWETPDILPWPAWIARSWASWFDGAFDMDVAPPTLLTPEQEQAVWETVIQQCERDKPLLNVPAAASLASEAWSLWRSWRLPVKPSQGVLAEDIKAFLTWAAAFESRCKTEHLLDGARAADAVAESFATGRLVPPRKLLLAGFDELTPQQDDLLEVMWGLGSEVTVVKSPQCSNGRAVQVALPDVPQEIALAARWARARLEDNKQARIGIVVPELGQVRERIDCVFEDVFHPAAVLPGASRATRAYNISLGLPLRAYPVVSTAFTVLGLAYKAIPLGRVGNLLRSPFVDGGEAEISRRALLDARLREFGELQVNRGLLARFAAAKDKEDNLRPFACPRLRELLSAFERVVRALPARQSPSSWAQSITALLRAFGWPGNRHLSSEEFQTVEAWDVVLRALSGLDRVIPELTLGETLTRLRHVAETVFQPESPAASVQVLGMLEASGSTFDHVWLMGMHDEAWPSAARPNPLLPIAMQRAHSVPRADAHRTLKYARTVTERLLDSAPEVIVSYPKREGDRDLRPSPLIAGLDEVKSTDLSSYDGQLWREAIYRSADMESLPDDYGPQLLPNAEVPGGTALFADQAACPFRAFVTHRLGARPIAEPAPGLDAKARGTLVHTALERIWAALGMHERLCECTPAELRAIVAGAVAESIAELRSTRDLKSAERFFAVEQERLESLLMDWLELEKQRAPFKVFAREQEAIVEIGGLRLRTRIDRMDELIPGGERVIVDYKTGKPESPAWFDDRLEQPQLPLYSVYLQKKRPAAVLVGHVRSGEMRYRGVAGRDGLAPNLKGFVGTRIEQTYDSWVSLFETWEQSLAALAQEIAAGRAQVDPKDKYRFSTCAYCALPAMCRVGEIFANTRASSDGDRESS
jgi:probable DNA repair protein